MKYIIDVSKLQKCDVILTRNKNIRSKMIRYLSEGDYSHALMCVSSLSLIEATIKGRVYTENPMRLIFDNLDDCKVLRYKNGLNDTQKDKMEHFLRLQVSTLYSVREAIRTAKYVETDQNAKETGQFCSRLVAQAFENVGINLVSNPDYCTPENLNSSELLEVVPDAIRIATEQDIIFSKTKSQIKENQIQNYLWLDEVVKLAQKEKFTIVNQNDVGQFLIKHRIYDKQVCNFINKTNYLNQYKSDEVVNPPRYKYYSDVEMDIETEIEINKSIINRHMISYANTCDTYSKTKLNYFSLLKRLYKNLLTQANRRLNVILKYIDRDLYMGKEFNYYETIYLIKSLQDSIREIFTQDGYKKYLPKN